MIVPSPLNASLPNWHPETGQYGRLDSLWRVRSHLQTPGQPKAGTVTITWPRSLWALTHHESDEKKRRRWSNTGKTIGLRQRGGSAILRRNDQLQVKERKQSFLVSVGSPWPKTGPCCSLSECSGESLVNIHTYFWEKFVLHWKLSKCSFALTKFKWVNGESTSSGNLMMAVTNTKKEDLKC